MFEDKVEDRTAAVAEAVDYFCEEALRELTEEVARRARRHVPRASGGLARAISVDTVKKGGDPSEGDEPKDWVGGVFADAEHAAVVEFGSAGKGEPYAPPPPDWPAEEAPEKQVSAPYYNAYYQQNFDIPKHGGRYKGRHPGVRPRPYLRPAISEVCFHEGRADKIFQAAFENAYRKARSNKPDGSGL